MNVRILPKFELTTRHIILSAVILKLLIHLPFNGRYGFHADELLHLSMAEELDWGFQEGPPLIAVITRLATELFGNSVWAVRLLPTLAGAALIAITGILTTELGGRRRAVFMACLAVLLSPSFLATTYFMQPVVFDQLLWSAAALCLIRYVKTADGKYMLILGAITGLGMLNKFSIGLYLLTLAAGLLMHSQWKILWNKHLLRAFLIGLLIFSPHLIWQVSQGFPFAEQLAALKTGYWEKQDTLTLLIELFLAHSVSTSVWFCGLAYIFFHPKLKSFRFMGTAFVLLQIVMLLLHAKTYYTFGAFPVLFATGGICIAEVWSRVSSFIRWLFLGSLTGSALLVMPAVVPVFDLTGTISYFSLMKEHTGIKFPLKWEDGKHHTLSMYYAQMLGWPELAFYTAQIYRHIPEANRKLTMIVTDNYELAGALAFYGKPYGLPRPVSRSLSFFSAGDDNRKDPDYIIMVTRRGDYPAQRKVLAERVLSRPYSRTRGTKVFLIDLKTNSL